MRCPDCGRFCALLLRAAMFCCRDCFRERLAWLGEVRAGTSTLVEVHKRIRRKQESWWARSEPLQTHQERSTITGN